MVVCFSLALGLQQSEVGNALSHKLEVGRGGGGGGGVPLRPITPYPLGVQCVNCA